MSASGGVAGARDRFLHAAPPRDGFVQGARHRGNARLGRGADCARSHRARSANGRRNARRAAQVSGRYRAARAGRNGRACRWRENGRHAPMRYDAARPAPLPARGLLAENVVHFVRILRAAGLPAGPARVLDALAAVEKVGVDHRTDFRAALCSVLVSRRDHLPLFDQAFDVFWRNPKLLEKMLAALLPKAKGRTGDAQPPEIPARLAQALLQRPKPQDDAQTRDIEFDAAFTCSAREVLQKKDFASMTADELIEVKQMLARLKLPLPEIAVRRTKAAVRGRSVDLRTTMRGMVGAAGAVAPLRYRARRVRTPPLVVLCDISGSMDRYARMLLHFLHAITNDRHRVHALVFGTRLTNITRHLKHRDVDVAPARVA